jgi:hypothetical protein
MNVVTGGHPNSKIFYFHTISYNFCTVQTHEVEVTLHTIGIIVTEAGKNKIIIIIIIIFIAAD